MLKLTKNWKYNLADECIVCDYDVVHLSQTSFSINLCGGKIIYQHNYGSLMGIQVSTLEDFLLFIETSNNFEIRMLVGIGFSNIKKIGNHFILYVDHIPKIICELEIVKSLITEFL